MFSVFLSCIEAATVKKLVTTAGAVNTFPKNTLLKVSGQIPASSIALTFPREGRTPKPVTFNAGDRLTGMTTGSYETSIEYKKADSTPCFAYTVSLDSSVYFLSGSTAESVPLSPTLTKIYFANIGDQSITISGLGENCDSSYGIYDEEGEIESSGSYLSAQSFTIPPMRVTRLSVNVVNPYAFVATSSMGTATPELVSIRLRNGLPQYTSTSFPEGKEVTPQYEIRTVESSDTTKALIVPVTANDPIMVRFTQPNTFVSVFEGTFTRLNISLYDGDTLVKETTYEYDAEKPLLFVDSGKYAMTLTAEACAVIFLFATSVPFHQRVVGTGREVDIDLAPGKDVMFYMPPGESALSSYVPGVSGDATFEAMEMDFSLLSRKGLEDTGMNMVYHVASLAEGKTGSVRITNEGESESPMVFEVSDTPLQGFTGESAPSEMAVDGGGDLVEGGDPGNPSNAGMIAGIVVGVAVVLAIVGVVVFMAVTHKACFAKKDDSSQEV